MSHHRSIHVGGLGLVLAVLVVPTAAAMPTDAPHTPRSAKTALTVAAAHRAEVTDCSTRRSPAPEDMAARQWRCAGAAPTSSLAGTSGGVDLRSPDARDAARATEVQHSSAPAAPVPIARSEAPHPPVPAPDTHSNTAAIVGGGAIGVLLVGSAMVVATRRRDTAQRDRTVVPQ